MGLLGGRSRGTNQGHYLLSAPCVSAACRPRVRVCSAALFTHYHTSRRDVSLWQIRGNLSLACLLALRKLAPGVWCETISLEFLQHHHFSSQQHIFFITIIIVVGSFFLTTNAHFTITIAQRSVYTFRSPGGNRPVPSLLDLPTDHGLWPAAEFSDHCCCDILIKDGLHSQNPSLNSQTQTSVFFTLKTIILTQN